MEQRALDITELVDRHYSLVYRYAYRLSGSAADADDLVQEAFLTAQSKGGQIREAACARSWLCTVVRNAYLKQLRSPGRRRGRALDQSPEPVVEVSPAELNLDFDEEALRDALRDLAEEFRAPLLLYYFGEHSYREIADQLELPIGTVMSRLSRAKAWLRTRLSQSAANRLVPAAIGHPRE
ncbi:MAG: RNA polymerase sigma factor [Planctomycetaceae bacterium]|nr:MAG: RNA polymerase sigma factor [Planctomycetaceae bacterium]